MASGVISAIDLWQRLHSTRRASWYLLDVRNEDEFARWPIDGASAPRCVNVPYFAFIDDPDAALARLPRDVGEAVVVCAKGDSSEFVKDQLVEAGLPAVHVAGGMIAWGAMHVPLRVAASGGALDVWQVSRYGKGCLSYLVASGGEAVVVDPSRFIGAYEELARKLGVRIVGVLDTHVHADHISGGAELARRTGGRYETPRVRPAGAGPIQLGAVRDAIRVLRTPGHTPESTSFLLASGHLLSGDTLFAAGVGRPDLGGDLESWGRMLYRSLRDVIAPLPGDTVVLPGHFASAREAAQDGAVYARLGTLIGALPEIADDDPASFVARVAAGVRPPPPEYLRMAEVNRAMLDPGEAADEWELGRNECAAAAREPRTAHAPPRAIARDEEARHA